MRRASSWKPSDGDPRERASDETVVVPQKETLLRASLFQNFLFRISGLSRREYRRHFPVNSGLRESCVCGRSHKF